MILVIVIVFVISALFAYSYYADRKHSNELALRNVVYAKQPGLVQALFKRDRAELKRDEEIRKYGKVFGFYLLGSYNISIAEPELIQLVMSKEFTNFTNRRKTVSLNKLLDNALSVVDGEQWKRIRSIVTPTFSAGKLKRMKPCIDDVCKSLVRNFENTLIESDVLNIKRFAGSFTMDTIIQVAFGVKVDSMLDPNNQIITNASKLFGKDLDLKTILTFVILFTTPRLAKLLNIRFAGDVIDFFEDFSNKIIEQKRREFRKDNLGKASNFIEMLLEAEEESETLNNTELIEDGKKYSKYVTNEEIISQCVLFFLAGFDTTATTITLTCYYLALHMDKQEKLVEEINSMLAKLAEQSGKASENDPYELISMEHLAKLDYLSAVINETLRLNPPATMTERRAGCDMKLETSDGKIRIDLRQDDIVQIPIYSLHHNEEYFIEPEQFQPERFLGETTFPKYAYIPFGAGPRNCVARSLALLEAKMAVFHIIRCFKLSPCSSTKIPLEWYNQGNLLTPKDILLKVEKR